MVLGKQRFIYRHRFNFYCAHGYFPDIVDHIDGIPGNDEVENLRPSDKSSNACNSKVSSKNTSSVKGVTYQKNMSKWCVRIYKNGVKHFGGYFADKEQAILAANQLRATVHKDFSRGQ